MIFYFFNFVEKNPFLIDCAKKETIEKDFENALPIISL